MGANVTTEFLDHFKKDWFLLSDFTDMFVGNLLGEGNSRSVYEYRLNPNLVIKIDRSGQFDNVSEWEIWHSVKDKPAAKFLAPIIHISSCGRVMIQRKTKPIKFNQLPKKVPAFMCDLKTENWGRIGKNIVCHDYANHMFYTKGFEMVAAEWRV